MSVPESRYLTFEEYLDFEEAKPVKSGSSTPVEDLIRACGQRGYPVSIQ